MKKSLVPFFLFFSVFFSSKSKKKNGNKKKRNERIIRNDTLILILYHHRNGNSPSFSWKKYFSFGFSNQIQINHFCLCYGSHFFYGSAVWFIRTKKGPAGYWPGRAVEVEIKKAPLNEIKEIFFSLGFFYFISFECFMSLNFL